jgi:hypothetical protein
MAKTEISKQSSEEKTPEIQLIEAVLNVMSEVNYLQKDDTVGTGSSSYRGISDEKVRDNIRKSMIVHGLICVPVKIDRDTSVERWTEPDPYSKTGGMKQKQQIFSDIVFTFRLYHTSGAHIEGQSSGHGIDSQDKSPGKAMTYAMKYFLLNIFMVPTGDDPDKVHSNDIEIPKSKAVETKVASEVVQVPLKTVQPEKNKPQYPTEEELKKLLYNGKGTIGIDIWDGVIKNWKEHGAALLYGQYIYTYTNKKFNYFIIEHFRLKSIEHEIKFRYNG